MPKLPDLVARIRLDTSGIDKGLAHVNRSFDGMGKHFDGVSGRLRSGVSRLGSATKAAFAGVGLGIAAGLAGATALLKGAFDEATEARKVAAQTAAVIKSTGGVAGVTAKHVDDLTAAISNKVGIDDEAIASGANLLLTFTKIANRVGKGNDVFDQATQVITDMSVALGTDVKGSAIQVGKALNDPIKGITALTRVGVSFSAQQKEQIKTLVASGDTLGAQKIILRELNTEFGGSAAAAATPMDRLNVVVGNLKENVGTALLPVVDKAASWLGERLPGAVDKAKVFFQERLVPAFNSVRAFVEEKLVPAFDAVRGFIEDKLIPAIGRLVEWFQEKVLPPLAIAAGIFREKLGGAIQSVTDAIERNKGNLQALGEFLTTKVAPVLIVVAALLTDVLGKALGALIDILGRVIGFFREMWEWAKKAAEAVGDVAEAVGRLPGAGVVKGAAGLLGKIPGFEHGGVVPGPIGSPQLAVVHGGERVIPNGGPATAAAAASPPVHFHTHVTGEPDAWALAVVRQAMADQLPAITSHIAKSVGR